MLVLKTMHCVNLYEGYNMTRVSIYVSTENYALCQFIC